MQWPIVRKWSTKLLSLVLVRRDGRTKQSYWSESRAWQVILNTGWENFTIGKATWLS
jgi:hypothetical protein